MFKSVSDENIIQSQCMDCFTNGSNSSLRLIKKNLIPKKQKTTRKRKGIYSKLLTSISLIKKQQLLTNKKLDFITEFLIDKFSNDKKSPKFNDFNTQKENNPKEKSFLNTVFKYFDYENKFDLSSSLRDKNQNKNEFNTNETIKFRDDTAVVANTKLSIELANEKPKKNFIALNPFNFSLNKTKKEPLIKLQQRSHLNIDLQKFKITESAKNSRKDSIKDQSKDSLKEPTKEPIKEPLKEAVKESIKELKKDTKKEEPQEEPPKEESIKDRIREIKKDNSKEKEAKISEAINESININKELSNQNNGQDNKTIFSTNDPVDVSIGGFSENQNQKNQINTSQSEISNESSISSVSKSSQERFKKVRGFNFKNNIKTKKFSKPIFKSVENPSVQEKGEMQGKIESEKKN